jgi:hypothetical protein
MVQSDEVCLKEGYGGTDRYFNNDGELVHTHVNKIKYLANTKERFYLMYSSMVLILKNSSDSRMKLFASLLERYSDGQEFSLGSLKRVIAKEANCSARTLEKSFTYLLDNDIVIKVDYRLYKVNPRHVFRGSLKNRNKSLKAILELGFIA